ncbi:PREDICTED: coiled-coil domain-containing protein 182 [Crocodylus porosus]|uniref:coiled-coil domain-containing protein 182 n=1 Tax=Crocodylus porosus TaxID=8502 RepID=UPI00093CE7E8|nr:PREDICTED: coiled-coil domain-containing protein 182 [Crocodylus porosus]
MEEVGMKDSLLLPLNCGCYLPCLALMANYIHSLKRTATLSNGETLPMTTDTLMSSQMEMSRPPTGHLISTLASAMCSQHAADMEKLRRQLKIVQTDMQDFKQEVSGLLHQVKTTLSYMMEVVTRLETSSHHMEQRLREEEDRGVVRSKVLAFLLPREKEVREKCASLERRLCWKDGKVYQVLQSIREK